MPTSCDVCLPLHHLLEAPRKRNWLFTLDRACRITYVEHKGKLKKQLIFTNFIPEVIYVPEHCSATTIHYIQKENIGSKHVVFEVEKIMHLKSILNYYKEHDFQYAPDDADLGVNDLEKLTYLEPKIVKLTRKYVSGVAVDTVKQHIARSLLHVADQMGARALTEGVERKADITYLQKTGYTLFQGYFLARPQADRVKVLPDDVHV